MPIYTKKGDRGKTSLFSGVRVWKYHPRIDAYGSLDELNTIIGLAVSALSNKKRKELINLRNFLIHTQETIFYSCSYLADLKDAIEDIDLIRRTQELEEEIDRMTNKMPRLNNFIFPGGSLSSAYLQNARAVCRRCERQIVKLSKKEEVDQRLIKYINRLSDYLFTGARFANFIEKKKEIVWER